MVHMCRMITFMNCFNINADSKHGFRGGRSTQTEAFSFVSFVYRKSDEGFEYCWPFFDSSKAFDLD